jgi:hypothetical protein
MLFDLSKRCNSVDDERPYQPFFLDHFADGSEDSTGIDCASFCIASDARVSQDPKGTS